MTNERTTYTILGSHWSIIIRNILIEGSDCQAVFIPTLSMKDMIHEASRVINCLDGGLVRGPVRTDRDGGEVQLLQLDPVDGAGARVLVPVSEQRELNTRKPGKV